MSSQETISQKVTLSGLSGLLDKGIEDWVFDLDNTIYPAKSNLFARVAQKMTDFLMVEFKLEEPEAAALKTRLFREYGTTMHGLMQEFGMESGPFLSYVHDIDLSDVSPDSELDSLLGQLPGRKHIFTNGTVAHAENILGAFGVRSHFDFIFDIIGANHEPKPAMRPYEIFLSQSGINPANAVMIEDMAVNLRAPAALGMGTIWIEHDYEWAKQGSDEDYVQYKSADIKSCLREILGKS